METLGKLFGTPARLKLLRLFYFNDDTAFTIAEAAFRTKVAKDAARKEMTILTTAGFLKKKAGKGGYVANKKYAHYQALQQFLRDTTDVSDADILAKLRRAGTLRLVTLSGIFTGAIESKIDLLIVGDRLEEKVLANAVHSLEAELGRELRYATFTTEEFKYRVGVYDRLLRDTFDYPNRPLLDRISGQ